MYLKVFMCVYVCAIVYVRERCMIKGCWWEIEGDTRQESYPRNISKRYDSETEENPLMDEPDRMLNKRIKECDKLGCSWWGVDMVGWLFNLSPTPSK